VFDLFSVFFCTQHVTANHHSSPQTTQHTHIHTVCPQSDEHNCLSVNYITNHLMQYLAPESYLLRYDRLPQ